MRRRWHARTVRLLLGVMALSALGVVCAEPAGAKPAPPPCHEGAKPASPEPVSPPADAPCGSVTPLACCKAPFSASSAPAPEAPPLSTVALAATATAIAPPVALRAALLDSLRAASPPLLFDTVLRL